MALTLFGYLILISLDFLQCVFLRPGAHLQHNDITERSRKPKKYLMLNVLCL